jgi:hypothetical protein
LNVTTNGPDGKFWTVIFMVVPLTVAFWIRGIPKALAGGASAKHSAKTRKLSNRMRLSMRNKHAGFRVVIGK